MTTTTTKQSLPGSILWLWYYTDFSTRYYIKETDPNTNITTTNLVFDNKFDKKDKTTSDWKSRIGVIKGCLRFIPTFYCADYHSTNTHYALYSDKLEEKDTLLIPPYLNKYSNKIEKYDSLIDLAKDLNPNITTEKKNQLESIDLSLPQNYTIKLDINRSEHSGLVAIGYQIDDTYVIPAKQQALNQIDFFQSPIGIKTNLYDTIKNLLVSEVTGLVNEDKDVYLKVLDENVCKPVKEAVETVIKAISNLRDTLREQITSVQGYVETIVNGLPTKILTVKEKVIDPDILLRKKTTGDSSNNENK